ncbi:hypothetical protein HHL19_09040 [Streptomyces sp. R302]|uniref:hypothetical protein n=1 Tax=unclassified Streptomyces TaxID=2593676 RepID=UPI00145C49FA|nr:MULTISPECIES: hypothetical protein [unclassified Streptomyces]NML52975.1 hypothetical protein [Streptomyces sp. R301]NML78810.1 hypothetical protein [Streptomyces sp. R302]
MRNSAVLEAARVPFAARYRAELHGGIARAANASAQGLQGTETSDDGTSIGYVDVDDDYLEVRTGGRKSALIGDSDNSANDWLNSGITEFGKAGTARFPAAGNTLGYDSDVFDLRGAPRNGADRVHVRLGSREDTVWLGALFPQADVRR